MSEAWERDGAVETGRAGDLGMAGGLDGGMAALDMTGDETPNRELAGDLGAREADAAEEEGAPKMEPEPEPEPEVEAEPELGPAAAFSIRNTERLAPAVPVNDARATPAVVVMAASSALAALAMATETTGWRDRTW